MTGGMIRRGRGKSVPWDYVVTATATVNYKSVRTQRTLRQIYDEFVLGCNSLTIFRKDANGAEFEDTGKKRKINLGRVKSKGAPKHEGMHYSVDKIGNVHMHILTGGRELEYILDSEGNPDLG